MILEIPIWNHPKTYPKKISVPDKSNLIGLILWRSSQVHSVDAS